MIVLRTAALLCALLAASSVQALGSAPEGLSAAQVAKRAEDNMRSDRTYFDARMRVESPRLSRPRSVRFYSWEDRVGKRSFIRIHEPAKDAGTGFLKLGTNFWMYVPRVERTVRIPPSMMLQSWMGSDFTNDDLVKESSEIDDYDHAWVGVEPALDSAGGERAYVIEYIPHEDAPVVWGRIVAWIAADTFAPLRQEFYDEDGEKLRVMVFSEHREVDGRHLPHRWLLTPLDKQGHSTEIELLEMKFDADFDEAVFTKRRLEKEVRR
jgi:outer membrane lipoprotein-sorting protein